MITEKDFPRPEDFPLGSLESRAAARAMLAARQKEREEPVKEIIVLGHGRILTYRNESGNFVEKVIGDVPTYADYLKEGENRKFDPVTFDRRK